MIGLAIESGMSPKATATLLEALGKRLLESTSTTSGPATAVTVAVALKAMAEALRAS